MSPFMLDGTVLRGHDLSQTAARGFVSLSLAAMMWKVSASCEESLALLVYEDTYDCQVTRFGTLTAVLGLLTKYRHVLSQF
jgi:hypothetical protein